MRIKVVLPAPFGPRSPKISPWLTERLMARSASILPYRFDSWSTAMTGDTLSHSSVGAV